MPVQLTRVKYRDATSKYSSMFGENTSRQAKNGRTVAINTVVPDPCKIYLCEGGMHPFLSNTNSKLWTQ